MAKTDRGDSNTAQIGRAHRMRPASGLRAALLLALAMLALAAPSAFGAKVASPFGAVYEHLSYGPRLAQQVNVFDSGTPNSPIVVLVHGGGWRIQYTLSRFASESMALQQQGFTVFDINYRQDSERRPAFPVEPEDVMLATRWAIDNAASFHGDPRSVFLLGGSAGGQLAGIAAEQMNAASPG
ncbi:MAG: esterase/lipase, partial [Solirubrobacterales bacterium]|nr:esterase/lipase [Solirubrobacterales bacterium]